MAACQCGEPSTHTCAKCKTGVCDDIICGTDTVDGYLCGSYTMWGCSRKYTTCDVCCEDKAIHEEDFVQCADCYLMMCDQCAAGDFIDCDTCGLAVCEDCMKEHECNEGEDSDEESTA